MAVPVAPRIRAWVVSKGKVKIAWKAVPGALTYRLYTGGATRSDPLTTGRNEQQTITIDATGGTFTISYAGQTTAAIDFDATGAEVQAALVALSNIGPNDVSVTREDDVITVEFTGLLAKTNVAAMTTDPAELTGGAGTADVATTVAGVAASDTAVDPGEIKDLTVGTRGIYAVAARNADGESELSNIVSLANGDYEAVFED